jgi:hypothetical protein
VGRRLKLENKGIDLKWIVLPSKVKGLPIFNFEIGLTQVRMYINSDNKWETAYEFEEQKIL